MGDNRAIRKNPIVTKAIEYINSHETTIDQRRLMQKFELVNVGTLQTQRKKDYNSVNKVLLHACRGGYLERLATGIYTRVKNEKGELIAVPEDLSLSRKRSEMYFI